MAGGWISPTGLLLAVTALAPLAVVLAGLVRPRLSPPVAILSAAVAFLLTVWIGIRGGTAIDLPWAPSWGVSLALTSDALGILYGSLATGVGLLVLLYAAAYMPRHLRHEERPPADSVPFWALMAGFMGAMVWLALAQDLVLLFVCWDATAIASYFLIGYDREHAAARRAAIMALPVTGVGAILFLIGALWLGLAYGTPWIPELDGPPQS